MARSYWLVNSNRSRVKRFIENTNNKDQFFKYMFIDSGSMAKSMGHSIEAHHRNYPYSSEASTTNAFKQARERLIA